MTSIKKLCMLTCILSFLAITLSSCMSAGGLTGRVVPKGEHEIGLHVGGGAFLQALSLTSGSFWRYGVYDNMDLSLELQGGALGLLYRYQVLGRNVETDRFALSGGGGLMALPGLRTRSTEGYLVDTGAKLGLYSSYHPRTYLSIYAHPIMHAFLLYESFLVQPLVAVGVRFGKTLEGFVELNLSTDIYFSADSGLGLELFPRYHVLFGAAYSFGR